MIYGCLMEASGRSVYGRTALSGQLGVCVISAQAETTEVPGTSVAKPARAGGRSECDSGGTERLSLSKSGLVSWGRVRAGTQSSEVPHTGLCSRRAE